MTERDVKRNNGRPRRVETRDVLRAGREIGLRDLSMAAVAQKLGISATAVYRHVDGRWGLERLVGEDILAGLRFDDDPGLGVLPHLRSFALQLRDSVLQHPGLAQYIQTLFPRGEGGRKLLAEEAAALERRGYSAETAIQLCSAVALVTIGFAAAEEAQRERGDGLDTQRREALTALSADPHLERAHRALPEVDANEYVRMWLGAAIRGFVDAAPPGCSIHEMRAALHAAGEDESWRNEA